MQREDVYGRSENVSAGERGTGKTGALIEISGGSEMAGAPSWETLSSDAPAWPSSFFDVEGGSRATSPIARLRRENELRGRIDLLEQAPLFSVLHPRDLSVVAEKLHTVSFHKGEAIFREGEPAERMFVVDSGRVKLSIASAAGQELLIAILGRGSIFGELGVIDRGARAMNARAMEATRVFALDADVFWTMLEHRPALARRLLELMARRLRRADQTSQDLIFFDAPTRLARRFLELAEDHAEPTGDGDALRITVKMTQDEVAQMIGVTRASANRLIGSFAGRGWIDWNDGYPTILNPEALVRRAR